MKQLKRREGKKQILTHFEGTKYANFTVSFLQCSELKNKIPFKLCAWKALLKVNKLESSHWIFMSRWFYLICLNGVQREDEWDEVGSVRGWGLICLEI